MPLNEPKILVQLRPSGMQVDGGGSRGFVLIIEILYIIFYFY